MRVRAKRAGFSEQLTPEQEMDLEPLAEKGHESVDLEGELERLVVPTEFGTVEVVLVGGQEADPSTIQEA
jgi:hypothetical protein